MNAPSPIRIAVISNNPDPSWVWIRDQISEDDAVSTRRLLWHGFSTAPERHSRSEIGKKLARRVQSYSRWRGVQTLIEQHRQSPFDLIVSHGPWVSAWVEKLLRAGKGQTRHLAYAFNFTDLPTGARKFLMKNAFSTIDAFAVFTDAEQGLYSKHFDIDVSKFLRAPWGVAPPLSSPPARQIEGNYIAALGGEARDYDVLCETARRCPQVQFVAIARPHNFDGLDCPANLRVLFNLPFEQAWAIVWHAYAAVLPLRSSSTPCGLVTLAGAMHLGKAQIASDAVGVLDYLEHDKTGLTVPAGDAGALEQAVNRLVSDPDLTKQLGRAAKSYAMDHLGEAQTVNFFKDLLHQWFA